MSSSAAYGATNSSMDDEDKYARHQRACCVRYGNTRVLCAASGAHHFPLMWHIGPNWLCMLVTYAISLGPLAFFFMKDDVVLALRVALLVSVVATTCAFTMVACSDPGVVFESCEPPATLQVGDAELGVICAQCQIRRPYDASHCSDCGVCIAQLDHHCPWTGKCIGGRTLRWFYVFLACVSVHVVLVGVTAATSYLT
ncbi:hypothetical protein PybrP1_006043 [[Pythium] brassicae (nom. inval.)]|nr:hypothetical protein PybrP1_006043 [[Pythium] brassicae (nom. inval.)]